MHAVRMKAVWGAQFREFFVMTIGKECLNETHVRHALFLDPASGD
jgi:hypothetical protein